MGEYSERLAKSLLDADKVASAGCLIIFAICLVIVICFVLIIAFYTPKNDWGVPMPIVNAIKTDLNAHGFYSDILQEKGYYWKTSLSARLESANDIHLDEKGTGTYYFSAVALHWGFRDEVFGGGEYKNVYIRYRWDKKNKTVSLMEIQYGY